MPEIMIDSNLVFTYIRTNDRYYIFTWTYKQMIGFNVFFTYPGTYPRTNDRHSCIL